MLGHQLAPEGVSLFAGSSSGSSAGVSSFGRCSCEPYTCVAAERAAALQRSVLTLCCRAVLPRALPHPCFVACSESKSPACDGALQELLTVGRAGLEPATLGLKVPCSTN